MDATKNTRRKIGILVCGYNRYDLFFEQVQLLKHLADNEVRMFFAFDGPKNEEDASIQKQMMCLIDDTNFQVPQQVLISNRNLGCDVSIPKSIDKVLEECYSVLVIEDDVRLSSAGLNHILNKLKRQISNLQPVVLVSMSGIALNAAKISNVWRSSPYFSAWGYGINRNFWSLHSFYRQINLDWNSTLLALESSKEWNRLSERKKSIWKERFQRGNYDYQIQLTMFLENVIAFAPLCRLADNFGFGRTESTHTRFKTPWFLKKSVSGSVPRTLQEMSQSNSKVLNTILIFVDSQTWAGDGYLSQRGRTRGIRTFLRSTRLFNQKS